MIYLKDSLIILNPWIGLRLCQSPPPELPVKESLLVREMQDSNNY